MLAYSNIFDSDLCLNQKFESIGPNGPIIELTLIINCNSVRTLNRNASQFFFHDGRVDLAHVASFVLRLYIFDQEIPRTLLIMSYMNACIVSDDSFV